MHHSRARIHDVQIPDHDTHDRSHEVHGPNRVSHDRSHEFHDLHGAHNILLDVDGVQIHDRNMDHVHDGYHNGGFHEDIHMCGALDHNDDDMLVLLSRVSRVGGHDHDKHLYHLVAS